MDWCKVLNDLTLEQMRTGVNAYLKSDDDWINAKIFRRLCLPEPKPAVNWQAYVEYKPKALIEDQSKDERNQRAHRENMRMMKEVLK